MVEGSQGTWCRSTSKQRVDDAENLELGLGRASLEATY
jgi:hypothetical protein